MNRMGSRGPKPKTVDVSCPNESCFYYGKLSQGNVTSRGSWTNKSGDVVRKYCCTHCGCCFSSRTGTPYQGSHLSKEEFNDIVGRIVNGEGIRQAARSSGHNKNTIMRIQRTSSLQCKETMSVLENDLELRSLQFDELTAVVKKNLRKSETSSQKKGAGSGQGFTPGANTSSVRWLLYVARMLATDSCLPYGPRWIQTVSPQW